MSILLTDIDATCAALGYSDGQRYLCEPDALQSLKHLIWILRRDLDNHEYRRHLGHAKVLQTDLINMLPNYIEENEFADVLIRLLIILTNPTLLLYREGPPKDNQGRKIFLELIDILQSYKIVFTCDKVWSMLFGKLQNALEMDWALRSEEQNLLIERLLVLIRNVLQVPANPETEGRADNDASVHDQVIWALHQSGILDLILYVISSSDEHQFHLHGLEILSLLYREQTAESLAEASVQRSFSEKQRDEEELIAARRREKQSLAIKPVPARHSRFGGTYVIRNLKSISDRDIICHQPLERIKIIDFDHKKQQQKRSFRQMKEEVQVSRRSAFSVRLCLREYCIEILRSAYNTLVRQVRRILERSSGANSHDDSYLLWAIRFFMEFNRLNGMQLHLISESLSVQCFHWVLTRLQHDMDMITTNKKEGRLWAKRLHLALLTFQELLQSLLALQKLKDDKAHALFDMLINNIFYVMEYRETLLHLFINYNEAHSTKLFLRDVVETVNIFLKMMEKFSKNSVLVQDKKRSKKRLGNKNEEKFDKKFENTEEHLSNKWVEISNELSDLLTNNLEISKDEQPLPFDATLNQTIENQKEECMKRIHKFLRMEKLDQAVALLRAAREVWPENELFGSVTAAPEDEMLLLREIFMHNITTVEYTDERVNFCEIDESNADQEYDADNGTVEKMFKFDDFLKRLLNPKIVRACIILLSDWMKISTKSLKATVTILHRIAYGCSCPAMLYHAKLFRIFQQVFNAPFDSHHEELLRLGKFIVRKFIGNAPNNSKIYAELLFYKNIREANELENGYCDIYESGSKSTWTEEQENELRFLYEENQRNPENDKDVIDWLLENLIDKTRTRRAVLIKLKAMGIVFKAPTKRSTAAAANKMIWRPEEDEELESLYDQYRIEENCLQKIVDKFENRKKKQQIIKRMLELHIIAEKSEIMPKKARSRQSENNNYNNNGKQSDDDENHYTNDNNCKSNNENVNEYGKNTFSTNSYMQQSNKNHLYKQKRRKMREIMHRPIDIGTIRVLINLIDEKFQEAIDWLKECFTDAAEDTEQPSQEDDGIPLLPLFQIQKDAMEDDKFQKLLIALGIQPPIIGMENYWRIPTYLSAADIKIRAQILAGEEINEDCAVYNNCDLEKISNCDDSYIVDDDDDDVEINNKTQTKKQRKESENISFNNILNSQRENIRSLLFSKSDEDDLECTPFKIKKKRKSKIYTRNYNLKDNDIQKSAQKKEKYNKNINTNAQIKTKIDKFVEFDELTFDSEKFRKRLLELGDTSDEDDEDDEIKAKVINKSRRVNVIHSDSDEQDDNDRNKVVHAFKKRNNEKVNDFNPNMTVEKINNHKTTSTVIDILDDNDITDSFSTTALKINKKRYRANISDIENLSDQNESVELLERCTDANEEINVKKDTFNNSDEGLDLVKRRRIDIIDNDDN